jgi:hypothetical protein
MQMQSPAPQPAPPISTVTEAEMVATHLGDVMDALLGVVEEETRLVRAGKLREATGLEATKTELSRLYVADTMRLKTSQPFLSRSVPEILEALRRRHDLFHALLQMNLTVLATAHAVSESIMRGVSDELARKATPQGYGASGRGMAAAKSGHQPLTVSRVL